MQSYDLARGIAFHNVLNLSFRELAVVFRLKRDGQFCWSEPLIHQVCKGETSLTHR